MHAVRGSGARAREEAAWARETAARQRKGGYAGQTAGWERRW